MEEKETPEQLHITPPPYSFFSRPPESRKTAGAMVLGLLLCGAVAAIITLTIYVTQKRAEKMVEMTYSSESGGMIHQTLYLSSGENIAAIFIRDEAKRYSASVLLDYNQKLIGIRSQNRCYLLRMEESRTPSLQDLLRRMDYYQANNSTSEDPITFSFILSREANPLQLGINVNLLCSSLALYWTEAVRMEQRRKDGDVVIIIIK